MTKSSSFRINSPNVIQETVGGKVVIFHLNKGDYYSLVKAGAHIWSGIERGMSQGDILENILELYSGDRQKIEKCVHALLEELQQEEIIVPHKTKHGSTSKGQPKINQHGEKLPFEAPTLGKYTDMLELVGFSSTPSVMLKLKLVQC